MKLIICEKPSVGAAVAAALGVMEKKTDISRGTVMLSLGVSGI